MPRFLLAHDLGTSGNKATLYAENGRLLASQTAPYPTRYFNGNWAEQDSGDWWRAVCDTTRALTRRVDPARIAVVSLSGQMMGCTPVDRRGAALRPSMLYCDQRATAEATRLLERIGPREFYAITGHRVSASYTLEKLMWLQRHEPGVYRRTFRTLCAKDYVNARLTGQMVTDDSDASGTNAFDLNTRQWSTRLIELAGVDAAMFPAAGNAARIIGEVTRDAARATGLRAGTPVAAGGGDGSCAGVGVGCIKPGSAYNYLGSSSWIALTVEKPIVDEQMRTMNWAHCVPGLLHPSGTMQTAGASFAWLKQQLCGDESRKATARKNVYALIDEAIAGTPAGANGVLFLPYLLGERTPWWNPAARGAFVGLTLATRREDLLRAVMEGVTLNLGLIVDLFRQHVPIRQITVIGGGANSAVWRQMMADVYACDVQSLRHVDAATSMGAAVIGGVAAGLFDSFEVIDRFIAVAHRCRPDRARVRLYRERRDLLEKTYRGLVDVFADFANSKPPKPARTGRR
jgi:xylulokinase